MSHFYWNANDIMRKLNYTVAICSKSFVKATHIHKNRLDSLCELQISQSQTAQKCVF